jgi:hypothetical protein
VTPPPDEIEEVSLLMARALVRACVPYMVTGSVASAMLGEPRATNDLDIVVELTEEQVGALAQELGPDFDVDEEALGNALRERRSWNIFYLPYVTKVDLFPRKDDPFARSAFERRQFLEVGTDGAGVYLTTAEDLILQKLLWYREGGEVSDAQWRDVIGIFKVSGASLDRVYLRAWSARLGLTDLLHRVSSDAKP